MRIAAIGVCLPLVVVASSAVAAVAQPQADELSQLVQQFQANPGDEALREKIIMLARKNPPPIPPDARHAFVMGTTIVKTATDAAGQALAVQDFKDALRIAPWWGDAYYNLALAQQLSGRLDDAEASLKLYILTGPSPKEVQDAQDRIAAIDAKEQLAQQAQVARERAARDQTDRQAAVLRLQGTWYGHNCVVGAETIAALNAGCTEADTKGRNWHVIKQVEPEVPRPFTFSFPGDGTVKLDAYESWAGCRDVVWGVAQGPLLSQIHWEVRPSNGPPRPVYSDISEDGSFLEISCDRPPAGSEPNVGYHYVYWGRRP